MLVEVRPLDLNKWHGKKGKESFTQPKVIEAVYDGTTGKYATGLTEEEVKEYGVKLGADLSNNFNPTEPHPYWSSKAAWVKLENYTQVFDTVKPADYVKVKLMKASKYVANSIAEWEKGEYPEASHVIFDEEEEVAIKATKVQLRERCILTASKMSADDKIAMVQVLSKRSLRGRSNNFIDVEIANVIEEKPTEFEKYAAMGREEINIRATVLELIYKNILTKENTSVYYMSELIGIDYEDAVRWFKDPNNSKMKVVMLEKLNTR